MANFTLDDLQQIAALEDHLETRACQAAIEAGREVMAGRTQVLALDGLRRDYADYQAVKSISDVAAGRSSEWALHEEARAELRREKLLKQHHDWMETLHRAVRSDTPNVELLKFMTDLVMEITDAVKSYDASSEEIEARFSRRLSELNKNRTPD